MRICVLGGGGGLGRNVVDEALEAGHDVRSLIREGSRAILPKEVEPVRGDAARAEDVARALDGCEAAFFCVNPPFERWTEAFPPLLDAAIEGARKTGVRLVFPANVWIYGRGNGGAYDEGSKPAPVSVRGRLRLAMENKIVTSGIRYALVRLPEFYGPHVVTLTARLFAAILARKRPIWPGPVDREVELVYMPDGARSMVRVGCEERSDAAVFHVPGGRTTLRALSESIARAADVPYRAPHTVPAWALRAAGLVSPLARGAADIAHLWSDPILLDGRKIEAQLGRQRVTLWSEGIERTIRWMRREESLRLQA